jgi:hypothetical protein
LGLKPAELGETTPAELNDLAEGFIWRAKNKREVVDYAITSLNNRADYWGSYICALLSVGLGLQKKACQGDFMPKAPGQKQEFTRLSPEEIKARIMGNIANHNKAIKGR